MDIFEEQHEQQLKELLNGLGTGTNINSINTLQESLFVNHFLPYFSGERQVEDFNDFMVNWVKVTGAPNNGVLIIDQGGNILYEVPPIVDTSLIDLKRIDPTNNLRDYVELYKLTAYNLPPAIAQQKFVAEGSVKINSKLTDQSVLLNKHVEAWNSILARYNLINTTTTNVKIEPVDEDILEEDN